MFLENCVLGGNRKEGRRTFLDYLLSFSLGLLVGIVSCMNSVEWLNVSSVRRAESGYPRSFVQTVGN